MDYSNTQTQSFVSVIPPAGRAQVTQQPRTQYGMGTDTGQMAAASSMLQWIGQTNTGMIPAIIAPEHFKPYDTTCPYCKSKIKTKVNYKIGSYTWLCCFVIGISGAPFACCIPCCMDSCKDSIHNCPTCNRQLLTFKRMECTQNARVAYFDQ